MKYRLIVEFDAIDDIDARNKFNDMLQNIAIHATIIPNIAKLQRVVPGAPPVGIEKVSRDENSF